MPQCKHCQAPIMWARDDTKQYIWAPFEAQKPWLRHQCGRTATAAACGYCGTQRGGNDFNNCRNCGAPRR